jgi:hypothetical protein
MNSLHVEIMYRKFFVILAVYVLNINNASSFCSCILFLSCTELVIEQCSAVLYKLFPYMVLLMRDIFTKFSTHVYHDTLLADVLQVDTLELNKCALVTCYSFFLSDEYK